MHTSSVAVHTVKNGSALCHRRSASRSRCMVHLSAHARFCPAAGWDGAACQHNRCWQPRPKQPAPQRDSLPRWQARREAAPWAPLLSSLACPQGPGAVSAASGRGGAGPGPTGRNTTGMSARGRFRDGMRAGPVECRVAQPAMRGVSQLGRGRQGMTRRSGVRAKPPPLSQVWNSANMTDGTVMGVGL